MDPIPTMVISTSAARRKGELVVTLDDVAGLREQLDKAERGLLAAAAAMQETSPDQAPESFAEPGNAIADVLAAAGQIADELAGRQAAAEPVAGCLECSVSGGRHLATCRHGARLAAIGERVTALSTTAPDLCACAHPQDQHNDEDDSDAGPGRHECLVPGCVCARFRLRGAVAAQEPPRVVPGVVEPASRGLGGVLFPAGDGEDGLGSVASVTALRPDYEVIPSVLRPCNEAHPKNGTLCTGNVPHPMPHVDEHGDAWVTTPMAVTS